MHQISWGSMSPDSLEIVCLRTWTIACPLVLIIAHFAPPPLPPPPLTWVARAAYSKHTPIRIRDQPPQRYKYLVKLLNLGHRCISDYILQIYNTYNIICGSY